MPALDRQIECREDETLFAAARRAGLNQITFATQSSAQAGGR